MSNQNEMTPPPAPKVNYDILPEGLNIIATGLLTSEKQYYDLLAGHQRDGYTHHIREPKQMDRWWEVAIVSRVVEGDSQLTLQKGCILIFYCGTRESFEAWQGEFMRRVEQLAIAKASGKVSV
jgi:hypothetical protein